MELVCIDINIQKIINYPCSKPKEYSSASTFVYIETLLSRIGFQRLYNEYLKSGSLSYLHDITGYIFWRHLKCENSIT